MKLRIVKEFRNRNTKIGKDLYYIQRKLLFGWQDISPCDIDAWFHGYGTSWDTFEEALDVYKKIEMINKIRKNKAEVVWPKPQSKW